MCGILMVLKPPLPSSLSSDTKRQSYPSSGKTSQNPGFRVTDKLSINIVYPSGLVCISILHAPGEDPNHYEQASERWSPIQSVEKILISVMSMLAEPNDESPANVEAAKMWRERRKEYEERIRRSVREGLGLK